MIQNVCFYLYDPECLFLYFYTTYLRAVKSICTVFGEGHTALTSNTLTGSISIHLLLLTFLFVSFKICVSFTTSSTDADSSIIRSWWWWWRSWWWSFVNHKGFTLRKTLRTTQEKNFEWVCTIHRHMHMTGPFTRAMLSSIFQVNCLKATLLPPPLFPPSNEIWRSWWRIGQRGNCLSSTPVFSTTDTRPGIWGDEPVDYIGPSAKLVLISSTRKKLKTKSTSTAFELRT